MSRRIHIILDEESYSFLKQISQSRNLSMSGYIRDLLHERKQAKSLLKNRSDPFNELIGAYSSEQGHTGRLAEEILYGPAP